MELSQINEQILAFIKEKGPSLPIQISKELGVSSIFISAFLSELSKQKRIKISHLKVGGSPLYLVPGQEKELEKFSDFLHPKEKEAFSLLKSKKVLKDSEQEPAIRVALREIKDFAIPFEYNGSLFWKYAFISDEEAKQLLQQPAQQQSPPQHITHPPEYPLPPIQERKASSISSSLTTKKGSSSTMNNKQKSLFPLKAKDFIEKNFKLIEEKRAKNNEYVAIVEINSQIGPLIFLTHFKNKKTISETDLHKLLIEAQTHSLPALLIYTEKITKKADEFLKTTNHLIKIYKVDSLYT